MIMLKSVIGLLLLPVIVSGLIGLKNNHTLNGVVLNKVTGKPLQDIYLYTVKGEEEALTDQRGEFKIVTWQKLPVILHIRYLEKENIQVKVTNHLEKIVIKL